MIAVSLVHGGPGPKFLSKDLVNYLTGQMYCEDANIEQVEDEKIRQALSEVC